MNPKSPPDITVFDIADWFLAQAKADNRPLKHMKLQKLVYFAYGWHYAYFDLPLFSEKIFAWPYGPVVKVLYRRYEKFGKNPIIENADEFPLFGEDTDWIVRQVWDIYSPCSDIRLSAITHRTNSPWSLTYNPSNRRVVIPPRLIEEYFKNLLTQYTNG